MTLLQDRLCVQSGPFHDRAAELCRTNEWVRVGAITQVAVYTAVEEEYWAAKTGAVLCDLSASKTYRVAGSDALAGVEHLIGGKAAALAPGQLCDTLWCNDVGLVIGHGALMREAADSFLIVTESACGSWIQDTLAGYDCTLSEPAATRARLGLSGPAANAIFQAMGLILANQLEPQRFFAGALRGLRLGVARLGPSRFELWTETGEARVLWDRLMRAGKTLGLKPAGTVAQTVLRLETGEPRFGVDYTGALTASFAAEAARPEAIGLDGLVDRAKLGFVGQGALAAPAVPGRRLIRILAETASPLPGAILTGQDQRPIGYLTSWGYAPALGASLGFGWVEGPDAKGPIGLVLPPDAGSGGKLRKVACRLAPV